MKAKKINLLLFSLFLAFLIAQPPLFKDRFLSNAQRPWQLLPFGYDSLSSFYKERYGVEEKKALGAYAAKSTKPLVMVLIDGWGVPYEKDSLVKDFSFFDKSMPKYIIYKRLLNVTSIIEKNELKGDSVGRVFIYGGDSTACKKKRFYLSSYFSSVECFDKYGDERMIETLDSLLTDGLWNTIAWTTAETREGDRINLQIVLQNLAKLARQHPEVQFIIQGTHRPILGTPETRRKYLGQWVPVVFIGKSFHQ